MDSVIDFIFTYKDLIFYCLLFFVSVVQLFVLLIKKPVIVSDSIKEYVLEKLPVYIIQAEDLFDTGAAKFDFVVESVIKDISADFNLSSIIVAKRFKKFIATNIEKILMTPKSKGGI